MERRKRSISHYSHYIAASPEKTFPLLCPVREYEWIEGWSGKLIYSDSGVVELDCVFIAAPFERIGPETWTCSHYEPPHRVDYVRISPHTVIRLGLTLVPAGTGTRATAMFVMTAVDQTGDALLADADITTCERHFRPCFLMLDHYLRTGAMLPRTEALALAGTP
ncbi:MAG TPA: hypothetical protein VN809_02605 [Telmatospirillum sp.]|nr:hypothetical protein [Telmatospirillum sp.]